VAVRLMTSQEELGPEFVVLSGGHGLFYSNGDTVLSVAKAQYPKLCLLVLMRSAMEVSSGQSRRCVV
jgi:hypothetical protein